MSMRRSMTMSLALTSSMLLAMHGVASAQNAKKRTVTYEQAWKLCKQALDKEKHAVLDTNTRYLRGGACMAKFGYRF